MNRRAFLRSLAVGLAALQLRFRPEPAFVAPQPATWIDQLFDDLHRLRATRGPEITILTCNPGAPDDWVYRLWVAETHR